VQSQTESSTESANNDESVSANASNDKTGNESDLAKSSDSTDKTTANEDFKPTEEISEDFPVSLPSDI
jgi:hypothetical protein